MDPRRLQMDSERLHTNRRAPSAASALRHELTTLGVSGERSGATVSRRKDVTEQYCCQRHS